MAGETDGELFPIEQMTELLTLEQAAERLRVTAETVRRWVKARKLPPFVFEEETHTVSYPVTRSVPRVRADAVKAALEARGQGRTRRPIDRAQAA